MVKMVMGENEALLLTKKTLLCQLNEAEQNRKNAAAKISALQLRYWISIGSSCTFKIKHYCTDSYVLTKFAWYLHLSCVYFFQGRLPWEGQHAAVGDKHGEVHADCQARETAAGRGLSKKQLGTYLDGVTSINCRRFIHRTQSDSFTFSHRVWLDTYFTIGFFFLQSIDYLHFHVTVYSHPPSITLRRPKKFQPTSLMLVRFYFCLAQRAAVPHSKHHKYFIRRTRISGLDFFAYLLFL